MSEQPASRSIVPEDVATLPPPGFAGPVNWAFSPDDSLITCLWGPEGTLARSLYAFDPATGARRPFAAAGGPGATEEAVTLEEALRRERARQLGTGVTDYAWAEKGRLVLIPLPDGIYVQRGPDVPPRRVVAADGGPLLDPRLSPDGRWIAYVRDVELYVVPAEGGAPRQLTRGARGAGRTHGLAEYAAQEEMGRREGFWWSDDSRHLAFEEVDETHIPVFRIVHQGKDATGESAQEDHRYPFAGQENARVRLGVVSLEGGEPVWMDLGDFEYLARVRWSANGLTAQLEDRAQKQLDLVRFDPVTGERTLLLRERSDVWINLHDLYRPLPADCPVCPSGFVWGSERTGFMHLYLYDSDGGLVRQLTEGDWMVDALAGVDTKAGIVYFTASRDSPLECHLYAVSLEGGEPRRLTVEPGMHAVVLDHGLSRFVDVHDALDRPPHAALRSLADGSLLVPLFEDEDPRVAELDLQPPDLVTLANREGAILHGALFRPPAGFGPGPHPTAVAVYGGPHVQLVQNSWRTTAAMRAQQLRGLGFLVFMLDNRGSARRGLAFEGAIRWDLGRVEVEDQVDGVRWLVAQGLADPQRVAIYGWSYGGYMAAMCLACAPETFCAAVAGAPVTAWDGYDTHYTERYMGTPQANPEGYRRSSVMAHAHRIAGKLLLVHGLIDENVHFRHTARLLNALIRSCVPHELMLFPDERHSPRRVEDRVFMEERIRDFLIEGLDVEPETSSSHHPDLAR